MIILACLSLLDAIGEPYYALGGLVCNLQYGKLSQMLTYSDFVLHKVLGVHADNSHVPKMTNV